MFRYEIHPGEGGTDAAIFATELAQAICKSFDATAVQQGRIVALDTRHCL